jgi:NAD+ synthase
MATRKAEVSPADLRIDAEQVASEIATNLRETVFRRLRRRGAVVGLSGGVDSSVVAALCVRAFGAGSVVGLLMPERESAPETVELSRLSADSLGIETILEDVTAVLAAAGCYSRRDAAFRLVIPEYGDGWKAKLVLPSLLEGSRLSVFSAVAESPDGREVRARLTATAYREIVAATNFKQRVRKMVEYHHADRLDFAVIGTPNRLEYDQGFFVKNGDGAADVKPIAHLYKTQVYQLAEHLGIPQEIRNRPPTTDTYSLPQSQEEFYFSLPYDTLDLCLYAHGEGFPPEAVSSAVGLEPAVVASVYQDIERKRRAAAYLHAPPLLVD